jgi:hypothetical protein
MIERYYIHTERTDVNDIKLGFEWLIKQIQSSRSPITGFLCVPTINNLRGLITSVIGERAVSSLVSGKGLSVPNSSSNIMLITQRRIDYHQYNGPMLVFYPDKKMLDLIDSIQGIISVLVVPWLMKDIQPWIDTWAPKELKGIKSPTLIDVKNPVVVAALKCLTETVNVSTGIHNPSDKHATIELFQRLKLAGEIYHPNEVKAWLIREGKWSPRDAEDVKLISEAVLAGKRFRISGSFWREDIVEQWRASAS